MNSKIIKGLVVITSSVLLIKHSVITKHKNKTIPRIVNYKILTEYSKYYHKINPKYDPDMIVSNNSENDDIIEKEVRELNIYNNISKKVISKLPIILLYKDILIHPLRIKTLLYDNSRYGWGYYRLEHADLLNELTTKEINDYNLEPILDKLMKSNKIKFMKSIPYSPLFY